MCGACGQDLNGACDALRAGCRIDRDIVLHRLERAGETLLAMRGKSPFPAVFRSGMPDILHEAMLAYGWSDEPVRPALPSAREIDAMDRAYAWLRLIPNHRRVLRRIVACRSLVSPLDGRHVIPWRRLGTLIRADHHAVQRWHAQGIAIIVQALQAPVTRT